MKDPFPADPLQKDFTHIKVHTWIPRKGVHDILKSIRVEPGTLSISLNLLISKLIHELKSRNITDISKLDEFERFVDQSVLRLPEECNGVQGPTTSESDPVGPGQDDPGTVDPLPDRVEEPGKLKSELPRKSTRRGKRTLREESKKGVHHEEGNGGRIE